MSTHARIALPLVLALIAAGCNDGKTPDPNRPARPASSPGAVSSAGAPAPAAPAALRIVALDSLGRPGLAVIAVSDPTLQTPRLFADTGAGFVDTGATPAQSEPGTLLFTVQAGRGARVRVEGTQAGVPVTSNVVAVGAPPPADTITILSPGGRKDLVLPPPVVAAPTETTWAGPQVDRFLVTLWRVDVSVSGGVTAKLYHQEQVVEVPGTTTRFAWGDPGLARYRAGSTTQAARPLPRGTWALTIEGLDAASWPVATSSDFFEFEVR